MAPVTCPRCGAENGPADVFCYKCEARLALESVRIPESSVPRICGALLIAVGVCGIITWLLALLLLTHAYSELIFIGPGLFLAGYIGVKLVLSGIAVVGGLASLRGRYLGALAGAIAGLFTFGPFFLFSVVSLLALRLSNKFRSDFYPTSGNRGQIL